MTINFDMDGTLADLYGVPDWLEQLRTYDASPYRNAKPLVNMSLLARYIHKLQAKGHKVVIVSWLSKVPTSAYDQAVITAKVEWLQQHLPSVTFDDLVFMPHGQSKSTLAECGDILFDDETQNRVEWFACDGSAYAPDRIFAILKNIIER